MAHTHEGEEGYFIDQVFTIALCGALSACAIVLALRPNGLFFLAEQFHSFVLWGGIAVGVMVLIRAISLWELAGKTSQSHENHHDHEHDHHDHDHHHEHHHHDHQHDHDHDHGWAPWRYIVLLIPVLMFFVKLPWDVQAARGETVDVGNLSVIGDGSGRVYELTFKNLEWISQREHKRDLYSGKMGAVVGQFVPTADPRQFNLIRYNMRCCAADAVPVRALLMIDPKYQGPEVDVRARENQWVRVTGQIQFIQNRRTGEYITALIVIPSEKDNVSPDDLIEIVDPPANKLVE